MSSNARFVLVVALAGVLGLALATPAVASPPIAGDEIGRATFQGRVVDLAQGWGMAQSCVVFSARDTRCFASHGEADALVGYSRETDRLYQQHARSAAAGTTLAIPACGAGWLCLYEHINGGGRRLQFSDEYWHYLSEWGFNRQTSSWRNNQGSSDRGHLSLYNSSAIYNCAANTYVASMGGYNDQAYAVWG